VGHVSLDLNGDYTAFIDLPLPCESEIVFARQKRVTSGYLSDDNAAVVGGFDAEIRRLTEQTAKLERQLTYLGRGDDSTGAQLVSGSRISPRDTSPDAAVLRRRHNATWSWTQVDRTCRRAVIVPGILSLRRMDHRCQSFDGMLPDVTTTSMIVRLLVDVLIQPKLLMIMKLVNTVCLRVHLVASVIPCLKLLHTHAVLKKLI